MGRLFSRHAQAYVIDVQLVTNAALEASVADRTVTYLDDHRSGLVRNKKTYFKAATSASK
jgi:hypothetical protein